MKSNLVCRAIHKLTRAIFTAVALLSLMMVHIKFCNVYNEIECTRRTKRRERTKLTLFNLWFLCFSFCFFISLIMCDWMVTRRRRSWHCNKRRKNNSHNWRHSIKPRLRIKINARTITFEWPEKHNKDHL